MAEIVRPQGTGGGKSSFWTQGRLEESQMSIQRLSLRNSKAQKYLEPGAVSLTFAMKDVSVFHILIYWVWHSTIGELSGSCFPLWNNMAVECLSLGKRLSWSLHCVDASQAQAKGERPANLRRDLYLFGIFTNPHGQGHKYKDRSRSWNDHEPDHPHKGSGTYEAPGSSGSEHPLL